MASDKESVDANVRHQLYVERLSSTNSNKLDPELKKLATWLRHRLADEGGSISSKKALNAIVADAKAAFGTTYTNWADQTAKFFNDLAVYESGFQTDLLTAETVDDYTAEQPTQKSTKALVKNTPMMIGANGGAVFIKDMVGNFSPTNTKKATDLLISGFYNGSTTSAIADSIIGTKKNQRKDGVMLQAKRSATSISKTGATHTSNMSKENVYKENGGEDGAVQGYSIVAVLDSRTSQNCRGADGTKVYHDDTYKPRPPFHLRCRTVIRPLLRSDLNSIKNEERLTKPAGEPEYESTNLQFYTWLKRQPAAFQNDILGPTQGGIFRNANLTPSEFRAASVTKEFEPLTIPEMAAKDQRIADYLASKE